MAREIVFGIHPVLEVLRVGRRRCYELWTSRSGREGQVREILRLAREGGVIVQRVSREEVERVSPRTGHQGVALEVEALEPIALEEAPRSGNALWVALDEVTDPHNLGAAVRSAACFGASAVLVASRRSAGLSPLVQKIASGATEHVPVVDVGNLNQAVRKLKKEGFWVYGGAVEGRPVAKVRLHRPALLLVGSEGKGLRRKTREHADELVRIPQAGGGVASLNASCAAAVLLYEFHRRFEEGG